MGSFQLCLYTLSFWLILCTSGVIPGSSIHEPIQGVFKKLVDCSVKICKYSKCRIPYCCNSTATFQLQLLIAGDVKPNPGPQDSHFHSPKPNVTLHRFSDGHIKYDRSFLLNSNPAWAHLNPIGLDIDRLNQCRTHTNRGVIDSEIFRTIKDLNIQASLRGKRGGHSKQKSRPIDIVSTHRDRTIGHGQRGVNFSNLQYIRTVDLRSRVALHLLNARSVRNKTIEIYDYAVDGDVDIFVITETWLSMDDPAVIKEIKPPGYSFMNFARENDQHGGIGILHKSHLNLEIVKPDLPSVTFELVHVADVSKELHVFAIYRPPPSTRNGFTNRGFLDEIDEFFGRCAMLRGHVIILGDFNVHVDEPHLSHSREFLSRIDASGFKQHVNVSTHQHGHTLDLVISHSNDNILHQCSVIDKGISEHYVIMCDLNIEKLPAKRTLCRSRNYRQLSRERFNDDLRTGLADLDQICLKVYYTEKTLMADQKEPSSTSKKAGGQTAKAGEGIQSIRSTSLFRAVNFELYAKPNKFIMGVGLAALTGCVVYIAYLNAQKENMRDKEMYEQYRADGTTMMRPRTSKWD